MAIDCSCVSRLSTLTSCFSSRVVLCRRLSCPCSSPAGTVPLACCFSSFSTSSAACFWLWCRLEVVRMEGGCSSLKVTDLSKLTCFLPPVSRLFLSAFSTSPVSWLSCASMCIILALASSALAGPG